jgi:two-component system, OmpR family, sensor kinase
MSVTTFRSLSRVEALWGLFALANVVIMVFLGSWETIPFHLVWLSMALLYGFRVWSVNSTIVLVMAVMLVTAVALLRPVIQGKDGLDELVAVPLMAGIFAAMAWHARRHQAAMEELQRTELERDFIRDASHQLRTPITVARGHAELILDADPHSPVADDMRVIARELQRLSTISDRLIMLAAAQQPGFVDVRPVDLKSLVEGTVTRWRPVAPRRWHARVSGSGTVLVDRERIECALDALIENAVNATKDGDLIEVAAGANGQATTIEVTDDGIGISRAAIPRIFERFSRGDPGEPGRNGGTGLGLPVVRAIAEAHGGSVTVSSEPSEGTTFRILLNGRAIRSAGGSGA